MNRFIAKVTIFDGIAFQTKKFCPNIYLGDPINIINMLGDQGAQEVFIAFADSFDTGLAEDLLTVCRMPVCLSGFIDQKAFTLGADKYVFGYTGAKNIKYVNEMSRVLGVQAVSLSLDYVVRNGQRLVVTGSTRSQVLEPLHKFLRTIDLSLFGELMLNSVDRDGQGGGADLEVATVVPSNFRSPVLLAGGGNFADLNNEYGVGVVSCSAISLIGPKQAVLVNYPEELSVR